MSNDTSPASAILAVIFGLVGAVLIGFLAAVVIIDLWGWFITPLFGLRVPRFAETLGLLLFLGMFRYGLKTSTPDSKGLWESILTSALSSVFFWLFTWGMGAIYAHFV